MLADVAQCPVERRRREHPVPLAALFAPEAEAAIDRTGEDRLQQHAVGIAVDETGQRRPALVPDRVGPVVGRGLQFGRARHELRRDRILRVSGVDQRRHVVGHGNRELFRDPAQLIEPLRRDEAACDEILDAQGQRYLQQKASAFISVHFPRFVEAAAVTASNHPA